MNDQIKLAVELTKDFNKNMWSRMTMQRNDPSIVTKNTPMFKQAISAITDAYPEYDFVEACFLIRNNMTSPGNCLCCGVRVQFRPGNTKEPYPKFCSYKCRTEYQPNPAAESITIDGVVYENFPDAIQATGLNRATIRRNIFDKSNDTYQWANDHDATCMRKLNQYSPLLIDVQKLNEWASSKESLSSIESITGIDAGLIRCAFSYFGITKTFEQISEKAIEVRDNKEKLQELYARFTTDEIAELIDVTPKSVQNWLHDHQIPIDYSRSQAKIERDMLAYIASIAPELQVIPMDRKTIGIELDIYVPERQFAIEFDGLRYHSVNPTNRSARKIHSSKRDLCYREDITLLRFVDIEETADKDKLEIVKSMISSRLGKNQKIFARKCEVRVVDKSVAASFFEQNHLSGNRGSTVCYGLYFNEELVECMSFGKPLMGKQYDWEIIRLATKKFTTVVGGASKLFKHFLNNHAGSIMSYVDCRHGNGKVYKEIGMTFVRKTDPGYFYTDMKRNYSRHEFQYPNIKKHCAKYDENLTEFENAEANGFTVYWNCGNLVYEYIR